MDNHYPTPPPAPRKDQTPLSCSEYDAEYDSDGDPRSPPPLKIFHNGRVYFHKSYKGPKPLGFVNTRLYEGGCRDFFVAYTETELVWARRMDYVLLGQRAKAREFIENLTAVKLNGPLTVLEFLERISPHLTE